MLLLAWSGLLFLSSVLPLAPIPHGIARIFDFPRTQVSVAALATVLGILLITELSTLHMVAIGLALAAIMLHLPWILPYTAIWKVQSHGVAPKTSDDDCISFLIANVLQTNRDYDKLAVLLRQWQPDIVVLMEVDEGWREALAPIAATYPRKVDAYLDNLYGMTVWSRLDWHDAKVQFIVKDDIPSVVARMKARNGEEFLLYAVHPEPPGPVDDTLERDAEIVLVGIDAKQNELPAVVTGDLNDVAWSRTTQRFLRISGLVDPRIGRGMYNSFHANFPFLRWPLDQLFHDQRFRLRRLKRLPHIGSDHFPILFELALPRHAVEGASPNGEAGEEDLEEAVELIEEVASNGRKSAADLLPSTGLRGNP